jgi:hypothetical protein
MGINVRWSPSQRNCNNNWRLNVCSSMRLLRNCCFDNFASRWQYGKVPRKERWPKERKNKTYKFQVLTAWSINMITFWYTAPCSFTGVSKTFQRCMLPASSGQLPSLWKQQPSLNSRYASARQVAMSQKAVTFTYNRQGNSSTAYGSHRT